MRTFKRTVPDIKTSDLKNFSKYFNQMQFKGILEDDNIYAIDQESFRDAKNIYVDSNERLVSRPTLQKEKLPENAVPYQYELDIPYPFALVSPQNSETHAIQIIPAWMFMYDMFAITRNGGKFKKRDKRKTKIQNIEFDPLAPDTMQEILFALDRIIGLTAIYLKQNDLILKYFNWQKIIFIRIQLLILLWKIIFAKKDTEL